MDRLTLAIPVDEPERSEILDNVPSLDSDWGGFLSRPSRRGLYEYNYRLALRGPLIGDWDFDSLDEVDVRRRAQQLLGSAYISFMPRDRNSNMKYLRVEFSPHAAGSAGRARLRNFLGCLLGDALDESLARSDVNRLDVGFDVYRFQIQDLLVTHFHGRGRSNPGARLFVGKGGRLETIYTPLTAKNYLTIYDKTAELNFRQKKVAKETGANYVPLTGARTRIEYRWHKLSKKLFRQLPRGLSNPFRRFDVREFPGNNFRMSFEERLFFDALKTKPREALFQEAARYCERSEYLRKRGALTVAMNRYPVPDWWEPDAFWSELPQALRDTGFFTRPATRSRRV